MNNLQENMKTTVQNAFPARASNLFTSSDGPRISEHKETPGVVDSLSPTNIAEIPKREMPGFSQMVLPGVAPSRGSVLGEKWFTFDHFVVGPGNRFAYEAAWAVANERRGVYSPFYLYGGSGLGKSHLAGAVGNHISGREPTTRILYTTAEEFVSEMVSAIRKKEMWVFKEKYRRRCDILLVDRVDFLCGKEKTQAELCHTLDHLANFGKQIILTAHVAPHELTHMNDSLKSRLGGGLVVDIQPPDLETRKEILRRKTSLDGVQLPQEIIGLVASRISGNVRLLEATLVNLVAKSSLLSRPIDLELAQEVVRSFQVQESRRLNIDLIQRVVATQYHIQVDQLISRSRRRSICYPRQLAMYLCRRLTDESLDCIGRAFFRDHASVIHSIGVIEKRMREKAGVRRDVDFLILKLGTPSILDTAGRAGCHGRGA